MVANRIEVMHGVNLDQLGRRDSAQTAGQIDNSSFHRRMQRRAGAGDAVLQSNHEGEFVEHLIGSMAWPTGSC